MRHSKTARTFRIGVAPLSPTEAALAFAGYTPRHETTRTKNLRDGAAIIIAKTGLSELANRVAGNPAPAPESCNAVAGFGYNLQIAFGFEKATHKRVVPPNLP